MKFSFITNTLKQYPVAVICALILLVLSVLIVLRGGVTEELSLKESELSSRIRTIERNIKNSNNIEQDSEDLAVIVDKIDALLFDRNERAININFFYSFEEKAGVVISDINQLQEPDTIYTDKGARALKLHSTLVFDITVNGTFTNILKFLFELHRVDPLIRVADFRVSRSTQAVDSASVNAVLRVLVLAKKD